MKMVEISASKANETARALKLVVAMDGGTPVKQWFPKSQCFYYQQTQSCNVPEWLLNQKREELPVGVDYKVYEGVLSADDVEDNEFSDDDFDCLDC